jgi:hypothetical protein
VLLPGNISYSKGEFCMPLLWSVNMPIWKPLLRRISYFQVLCTFMRFRTSRSWKMDVYNLWFVLKIKWTIWKFYNLPCVVYDEKH